MHFSTVETPFWLFIELFTFHLCDDAAAARERESSSSRAQSSSWPPAAVAPCARGAFRLVNPGIELPADYGDLRVDAPYPWWGRWCGAVTLV